MESKADVHRLQMNLLLAQLNTSMQRVIDDISVDAADVFDKATFGGSPVNIDKVVNSLGVCFSISPRESMGEKRGFEFRTLSMAVNDPPTGSFRGKDKWFGDEGGLNRFAVLSKEATFHNIPHG